MEETNMEETHMEEINMEEINIFKIKEIEDFSLSPRFTDLVKISKTLPPQRSPGWFAMRIRMITASDWGSAFGKSKFKSRNQLILDKCGFPKPYRQSPITLWGTKYEDVAVAIYESRTGMKIYEFGCMPHPEYDFLGASPDGISESGIMLEIKCPPKRKIDLTIPAQYVIQMQGQLEVCNLERCDYIECEIDQLDKLKGQELRDVYNSAPMEKGATAEFLDDKGAWKFFYSPLNITIEEGQKWFADIIKNNIGLKFHKFSFWKLRKVHCTTIMRDREWFNKKALPLLRDTWETIMEYRAANMSENDIRRILGMRLNKKAKDITIKDKEDIHKNGLESIRKDTSKMNYKEAKEVENTFINMQYGECMFSITTRDMISDNPQENYLMFSSPTEDDLLG